MTRHVLHVTLGVVLAWSTQVVAQDGLTRYADTRDSVTLDHPAGEILPYSYDSGPWSNPKAGPLESHQHTIQIDGAAWLRVYFDEVALARGSYLRIISRLDNESQELDGAAMAQWSNTSAYFNGDEVTVELVSGPGARGDRFIIGEVARLYQSPQPLGGSGQCGICDSDNRVPSSEEWTSRLFPAGCTASVYNDESCMVSAGHCVGGDMVVQFNVPASLSNCNTVNPPIADQFPIVNSSSVNGGPGNDWSVLIPGTNNLGQLPFERYGVFRPIAASVASPGQTAEITGYGVDLTCVRSQTQQTSSGPINQVFSNAYTFSIDLRGGNSGSSLMRNDQMIGIATHCPCPNVATRIDLPSFAAARAAICGAPPPQPPVNDDCADAIAFNNGNGDGAVAYDTSAATTDGPTNPSNTCNDFGQTQTWNDIWYTYEATCTGTLTVTTCDDIHGLGDPNYDTDLVVYGPYGNPGNINCSSGSLLANLLACNDDDDVNSCGIFGPFSSTIETSVAQGSTYLLRVGGWSSVDSGTGWLSVDCAGITTGACCNDSTGACAQTTQGACGAGNTYQGDGIACSPNPCTAICALLGDIDGDGFVRGPDIPGFIRAKLGQPPAPGENPACADYGSGTLPGDLALFVLDLLS